MRIGVRSMVRPAPGTDLLNATCLPFRAVAKPPRGRTPVDSGLLNQSVVGVISPEALTKGGKQPALPLESQEETIMALWHNVHADTEDRLDEILTKMLVSGKPMRANLTPNKKGTGWVLGYTFDVPKTDVFISNKAYVAPTSSDESTQDVNPGTEAF